MSEAEASTNPGRGPRPASFITRGRPWVGIAANAGSGRGNGRSKVCQLVRALRKSGLRAQIAWTPADRASMVAESSLDNHCRCLVAVGGDGTLGALVNELPQVPISVLPAGTENLFAQHFRLGRDPAKLAAAIAAGRIARIDLGLAPGNRRFTLMAGFGFDAEVVTRHHLARVGHTGISRPTHRGMYVDPVLRSTFGYRFPPITVNVTDPGREETLVGATVFVFNLPRYALGLPFAPSARADDGLLDLIVFREPGAFRTLHYLWLVVRGLHFHRPDVEHRKIRDAVVTSATHVPIQLDGDPGGIVDADPGNAWTLSTLPSAVDILVPASFHGPELTRERS